jgi:maltose alpha-D-glucosyltransferase/alpha-amylase
MERLIRRRRECPELGWGSWSLLPQDDEAVFALRADWEDATIVTVHNLAGRDAGATLAVEGEGTLVDLLGTADLPVGAEVSLPAYGHRWYRVQRPGRRIAP